MCRHTVYRFTSYIGRWSFDKCVQVMARWVFGRGVTLRAVRFNSNVVCFINASCSIHTAYTCTLLRITLQHCQHLTESRLPWICIERLSTLTCAQIYITSSPLQILKINRKGIGDNWGDTQDIHKPIQVLSPNTRNKAGAIMKRYFDNVMADNAKRRLSRSEKVAKISRLSVSVI